jgi:hypothetical protein
MTYRKLRIAWSVAWGMLCFSIISACFVLHYGRASLNLMRRSGTGLTEVGIYEGQVILSFDPQVPYRPEWAGQTYHYGIRYNVYSNGSWYLRGTLFAVGAWLAVLAMPLVALPWLSIKRFSLRALLIATTLIAMVLGLIVWAAR